jgi:NADH-quinone oxidoreductase subunit L
MTFSSVFDLLFLTFAFPIAGFVILAFARGRLAEAPAAVVGVGSIGLSFLVTIVLGIAFLRDPPAGHAHVQLLWTWMSVDGFAPAFALRLDALSLTMLGVITGVGFFIHLFASWYMRGDEGYDRFFSYMNLFVASMIFLVLGDNLLFLYFGWEGVGLCSYLLIGFWYKDPANGAAARKAFIVTRIGDTFMAIGLFILFHELGTLNIQELLVKAPQQWAVGSEMATIAALLLLGGAVGKSAQLPLQTWLPDAMAGPTPVSALIHAATMVTAGVYLIARTHVLFELSPFALQMVGWVGAVTLLLAGFTALTQTDIKRVLAYSTMSQIGYMFLALGAGAWSAGIFHLMTHAFFKALLFLSAGSVILAMHHEQDMFRMGGLRD